MRTVWALKHARICPCPSGTPSPFQSQAPNHLVIVLRNEIRNSVDVMLIDHLQAVNASDPFGTKFVVGLLPWATLPKPQRQMWRSMRTGDGVRSVWGVEMPFAFLPIHLNQLFALDQPHE